MPAAGRLTLSTALLLVIPPLLWAGNAVVGRLVHTLVSPMTLNFLRWLLAFGLLLPLAGRVLRQGSPMWAEWRRLALLGLLGVGSYNALQYLALQTSQPINTTLVGASMPLWMLLVGTLFFKSRVARPQAFGALLSMAGVMVVLSHGRWETLMALRLVPGDGFMVLATIVWAFYSWLLAQPRDAPELRADWSGFLIAQMVFGLGWSGLFAAGEWTLTDAHVTWGWPLAAALAFVAVGPAIIAYRCFTLGIQRAGPHLAGFFMNLTPLFAALFSAAFLGEPPHLYHAAAFLLIAGGILVSSRR